MTIRILFLIALLAAVPLGGLITAAFFTPITISGIGYLLGLALAALAGLVAPWKRLGARRLLFAGLVALGLTAGGRLITAGGGEHLTMITLPAGSGGRWINRLIDEQDVTLFANQILPYTGMVLPDEQAGAIEAFHAPYRAIRQTEGAAPSPFVSTYLGLQRPGAFDAIVIEPDAEAAPRVGVIFLHGFGGNFTMQCWLFAQAARDAGAVTVCPSEGVYGQWWAPHGKATLQATLDYLRQRGVERVYLAGLSNGGVGASKLAPKFAGELTGLILISGASSTATDSGLPALVIHSAHDDRIPAEVARAYAARVTGATYVELPGDHFLFAKDAAGVRAIITGWLRAEQD